MWGRRVVGLIIIILGGGFFWQSYDFWFVTSFPGDMSAPGELDDPIGFFLRLVVLLVTVFLGIRLVLKKETGAFSTRFRALGFLIVVNALLAINFCNKLSINMDALHEAVKKGSLSEMGEIQTVGFFLGGFFIPLFIGLFLWVCRWFLANDPKDHWNGWNHTVHASGLVLVLVGMYSLSVVLGVVNVLVSHKYGSSIINMVYFHVGLVVAIGLYLIHEHPWVQFILDKDNGRT